MTGTVVLMTFKNTDPVKRRRSSIRTLGAMALAMFCISLPACQDADDDSGGGDSDGLPPCPVCEEGEDTYLCVISGDEKFYCFEDLQAAQQSCGLVPGNSVAGNGPVTCDNQSADTDSGWSPGNSVTYNAVTDEYEIDEDFFDSLLLHPDQLLHDRTRLEWTGSYFEFQGILTGDLADELGFQSGDQLDSVNGYDVSTVAEAWTAFGKVYGSNSFTVHVTRSGSVEILEYVLVP